MGHDNETQLTAEDIMSDVYQLRASTPAEIERRRHVLAAIADSRIEGSLPGHEELEIFAAYIRGTIRAEDLMEEMANAVRRVPSGTRL